MKKLSDKMHGSVQTQHDFRMLEKEYEERLIAAERAAELAKLAVDVTRIRIEHLETEVKNLAWELVKQLNVQYEADVVLNNVKSELLHKQIGTLRTRDGKLVSEELAAGRFDTEDAQPDSAQASNPFKTPVDQ